MLQPAEGQTAGLTAPSGVGTFFLSLDGDSLPPTEPQAPDARTALPPPEIPGYTLEKELGRGGMGVVYLATDRRLKRPVALKMVLAGAFAGADDLARFRAEAEIVARLQHPNIVQIYEIGDHAGLPYLALEYVPGPSLSQFVQGRPLPPAEAARLVATLARTMDHVHRAGIVHRDLKPANVLGCWVVGSLGGFQKEGTDRTTQLPNHLTTQSPKITDFGLAKLLGSGDRRTRTGDIVGTPNYIAPEQCQGKGEAVGPAADTWALGAILYECLTGRPPFQGVAPLDTIMRVLDGELVAPGRVRAGVPADLETICLKCLQKAPGRRYASAGDLADDLNRFLDGEAIRARPVTAAERALKWLRRRPAVAALSTAVVLLTALSFALVLGLWQSEAATAAAERQAKLNALEAQSRTAAALFRAETILYSHRLTAAEREWLTNDAARARRQLDECPPAFCGWEWHYLRRRFQGSRLTLAVPEPGPVFAAFTAGGRQALAITRAGALLRWDAADGTPLAALPLAGHAGGIDAAALSPDGALLATGGRDAAVRLWEVATGREVATLRGHGRPVFCVAFSPDGMTLASGERDLRPGREDREPCPVLLWDVARRAERARLEGASCTIFGLAFDPDGRRVAAASSAVDRRGSAVLRRRGEVVVWEVAAGPTPSLRFECHADSVFAVAFSPDGQYLATGSGDRTAGVWRAADGAAVYTLRGHTEFVSAVAFSPDGQRLATAGWDRHVRLWDLADGTARSRDLHTLKGHLDRVLALGFSPDGRQIVTAGQDRAVKVWSAQGLQDAMPLDGWNEGATAVTFSPDGRHLAAVGFGDGLRRWDLGTGRPAGPPGGPRDDYVAVAYTPDGRHIVGGASHGRVVVWDAEGSHRRELRLPEDGLVTALAVHPDGATLAAAAGRIITLWDMESGQKLRDLPPRAGPVAALAFTPDGRSLVVGVGQRFGAPMPGGGLTLIDPVTGQVAQTLAGTDRVNAVAVHGRLVAAGGPDGDTWIFDLADGGVRHHLRGHTDALQGLALSPDGRRLATCSRDRRVKLWDVTTGQELVTLQGHSSFVYGVAFSPDGHRLASAGNDRAVKLWDGTPLPEPSPPTGGRP